MRTAGDCEMKSNDKSMNFKRRPVSAIVAAALLGLGAGPAFAIEFSNGELTGSFDTTISYGATWRVDDPDPENLGKAFWDPTIGLPGRTNAEQREALGRWSRRTAGR